MAKKETVKPDKKSKEKPDKKDKKDKKGKNKKGDQAAAGVASAGVNSAGQASVPLSAMTPEQMTAAQLEQAIKESNDPESRLKRLRSPFNVRSCLLNILILIVLTLGIVILWCYLAVDKFNFVTVVKDMSSQFGITQGFQWLGDQIRGWFS